MSALAVEVRNLTVTYPDGRAGLQGVSLEVGAGESVALVGANGAGKSTLLLSLVGVLRGSGDIRIAGLELTQKTLPEIRRKAQLVFQDPNDQLFMPVLQDDVAFGPLNFGTPRDDVQQVVAKSLESVGLSGFEERNPHNLSLGERKRAAIATVLACEPEILLMDEPGAGLDPRGKREFTGLLNSLPAAKLIATHDLDFARRTCSRAVILMNGTAAVSGPIEELLADAQLLDRCRMA